MSQPIIQLTVLTERIHKTCSLSFFLNFIGDSSTFLILSYVKENSSKKFNLFILLNNSCSQTPFRRVCISIESCFNAKSVEMNEGKNTLFQCEADFREKSLKEHEKQVLNLAFWSLFFKKQSVVGKLIKKRNSKFPDYILQMWYF